MTVEESHIIPFPLIGLITAPTRKASHRGRIASSLSPLGRSCRVRLEKEGEKGAQRGVGSFGGRIGRVQWPSASGAREGERWPWSERMKPEETESWTREDRRQGNGV